MTPLISYNPATGEEFWRGDAADGAAVDAAMRAARAAFPAWEAAGFAARKDCAERFRAQVEERKEALAELIARETGKPLWDARGEVTALLGKIAISIQAYAERAGEKSGEANGVRQELRHRPHGVLAVFGPYNFPAHLPNGHIVPALLAGNTLVFKPSEETPAVGAWMAERWSEADLPEGVLNLVQGARDVGIALTEHPELNGVLFTGSHATGRRIHEKFAGRPEILLALEMGGNNPLIIWEAERPEFVAALVIQSAYGTSGQRCTCARRLIVPDGYDLTPLQEAITRIRVGSPTDTPEPFMGALINNAQAELLLAAQALLLERGATPLLQMRRLRGNHLPFLSPGLLDVTAVRDRPDEEYFGPLLQVIRVPDFAAALREANATRYGLAAGLISDQEPVWQAFRAGIRAGVVNWNRPTTGASSASPFGGVGWSGNLRPAAYYAADYCAYPVATSAAESSVPPPGVPGID
jgi:succinylglutamic semialdehyde dehydrogenase